MNYGMEAITTSAVSLALDAAALRQQVISANIANASAPGYIPQKVRFEEYLEGAKATLQARGRLDAAALQSFRVDVVPVVDQAGMAGAVKLDMEMADMARNAVHFQALARGLSRHFSILQMAANDGKR